MARNPRKFNTRQVMAGFNVSDMTIFNWRQGSAQRKPLPITQDGRQVVFREDQMVAWAKEQGIKFNATAAATVEGPKAVGTKPTAVKTPPQAKKKVVKKAQATA